MRVLNDREEKSEVRELGFFEVLSHTLLCALGISTFLLAPLPMTMARIRLADPWPYATGLMGAVIALLVLEVPLPLVVLGFVLGLYVADSIVRQVPLGKLLASEMVLAAIAGAAVVAGYSIAAKMPILSYWTTLVGQAVDRSGLQAVLVQSSSDLTLDSVKSLISLQGPSLFLSAAIFSTWLSVGLAAHFDWLPPEHKLSGNSLRNLKVPKWGSLCYLVVFLASLFLPSAYEWAGESLLRVASVGMLVQGTLALSRVFELKNLKNSSRAVIYFIALSVGFYVLVAVGIASPLMAGRRAKEGVVPLNNVI